MDEGMKDRGYIFGADIVLAVVIFILLFGAMQYSLSEPGASGVETLQMKQIMDDVLSLLDRDNVLQTFNTSTIANAMNEVLPDRYDYRVKMEKWAVSGSTLT